jgi:hypothetical protein
MCKYEAPTFIFLPFTIEAVMNDISYGDNYCELLPEWMDLLGLGS